MEFAYEKHNPWWQDPDWEQTDPALAEYREQLLKYHHPLLTDIPVGPGVLVIRGPRRIGKTTLLKLIITTLLGQKKTDRTNIFYYPCNRIGDFNELYDLITGYLGTLKGSGKGYILLDEVTFVREWQRTIKDLWDSGDLRQTTVILTGSNAIDLLFSSERLPGRRGKLPSRDVTYYPLQFHDFVTMVGRKKPVQELFQDFLLCGGFPQAINEYYGQGFISNDLYETYLTWIEGDMHKAGKSEDYLYAILDRVIWHLGSTTSWYTIAKDAGIVSHSTVHDYIDLLGKLFVLFPLNYYSIDEHRVYVPKNKKLYFFDPLILHAVSAKIAGFTDQYFLYAKDAVADEKRLPAIVENVIASHLRTVHSHMYYGRFRGKEVDFVIRGGGKARFFEVKYQRQPKLSDVAFWEKKEKLTVITPNLRLSRPNFSFVSIAEFLLSLDLTAKSEEDEDH